MGIKPAAMNLTTAAQYCGMSEPFFKAHCTVKPIEFTDNREDDRYLTARLEEWLGEELVYFISCGDFVKIGVSVDPNKRLQNLQTANPFKLKLLATTRGGYFLESHLHTQFEFLHHRNEWFRLEGELKTYVDDISDCGKPVEIL